MERTVDETPRVAVFDLDKTILATSSAMALRHPLWRAGLITRRTMAVGLMIQLPYLLRGADRETMERMRQGLGAIARGWDPVVLEATVRGALEHSIDPVCHTEALDLIAWHRDAGHAVVIASASLQEMVRPIADLLGVDAAIASVAEVDADGILTGRLLTYANAEEKARACAELCAEKGWDLATGWAYSDSVTDVPLLESVAHPVAVNPDRWLLAVARARNWEVARFTHTVRVRPAGRDAVLGAAAGTLAAGLAGVIVWRLAHRLALGARPTR